MKKTGLRKPQNYDGTQNTSRQLSDLVGVELARLGDVYQERSDLLIAAWPEIIGPQLSMMTQVLSFSNGVLTVKVRNSTLHSLLSTHDKARILSAIKQKFPKVNVQNIVFRIG